MTDYIFDIDGTLADCAHRRHWVATKPKNWPAFFAAAHMDPPIQPIADLVRKLHSIGDRVILCSGRNEWMRGTTEEWLIRHEIPYERLYMRPDGDSRADDIVKSELLDRILADGYEPSMVFDDRSRVVKAWRSRGLLCAQVAEGDF